MTQTKYLRGPCASCGGIIEYPAHLVGTHTECPHCGTTTELALAKPPDEPVLPRRVIVWTAVTVLVFLLGLAGTLIALKRAERWAARKKATATRSTAAVVPASAPPTQTAATTQNGFAVSGITLQRTGNNALIYAVGTVQNQLNRDRRNVTLELDLLDAQGNKIGLSRDSLSLLKPSEQWHFKAPVLLPKAANARLVSVTETP